MVVHPSFPAKTVPEFIAFAKANPRKVSMASAGIGTPSHMSGELFKMMAGINMAHVPYRGAAQALVDLLGGQVQVFFSSLPSSTAYVRTGNLRALGVNNHHAFGDAAGRAGHWRFLAGLRGKRNYRPWRTQEHACWDHRNAQQRDQCGPCRSQD